MEPKSNTCIIGIGSNINADTNIKRALDILGVKVKILKTSSFVLTKPIGLAEQPDFTNGAVKIETSLSREELKIMLTGIEDKIGRDRSVPKFGSRTIDLDIITWNGAIVDNDYYARDYLQKSVFEVS